MLKYKIRKFTLDLFRKVNVNGYIVTVDIEKAFGSSDHTFFLAGSKKLCLNNNSTDWIKTLYTNQ